MKATEAGRSVAQELRTAGIPDAQFEGELLIRAASGLDRVHYFAGAELDSLDMARVEELKVRRLDREPTAYITGCREFYALPFHVTSDVLVPRPETELLVEVALEQLASARGQKAIDVGTGSGCVAVAIAKHASAPTDVTGIDLSLPALKVGRRNAAANSVDVQFAQGHLAQSIRSTSVIVANLPYIPSAEIAMLEPEVGRWEPRSSLDGGGDGLDLIRSLIHDCGARLRPELLALEVGFGQAGDVSSLAAAAGADTYVLDDLAGIPRVVCARWR